MKKRGFTLMELMVYIAILGIVVLVAGQAFSNSTKIRVRTQSMIRANEVASNVGAIMRDDIAQMGAKSAMEVGSSTTSSDVFFFSDKIYMNASEATSALDSSSFSVSHDQGGTSLDSLTIRRIGYDSAGVYVRAEEVSWYARDGKLYRSCKTLDGTADNDVCPKEVLSVEIASNVDKFIVTPSKPNVLDGGDEDAGLIFPKYDDLSKKTFRFVSYYGSDNYSRVNTTPATGGNSINLSGLITNYTADGSAVADPIRHMVLLAESGSSDDGALNCKQVALKKDSTYEITFNMDNPGDETRMFKPGIDHFAVGIRKMDGSTPVKVSDVDDYIFYPPQSDDGMNGRTVRFKTHEENVNACFAFTLVFYSPTVSLGSFTISNFRVHEVGDYDYTFEDGYSPAIADKKNVRALRLQLNVKSNGESGYSELVIPVPSNGVRG